MKTLLSTTFAALLLALPGHGAVVAFERPDLDVWMYENGFNRGYRENAPIFGGPIGLQNGSEDRFGQLVMGWDTTAAGIPAGLGAASYQITRVTFRATHINDQVFAYDPSYDAYQTYLDPIDEAYVPDSDTGRPIELHGLGLRNGYTGLALSGSVSGTEFGEATTSMGTGVGEHTRHAFAYSPSSPRGDGDVSENVSEGFESRPFAIGLTSTHSPGELVDADTEFTFTLNLADPAILNYLQDALDRGELGLTLSSLHPSSFSGQPGAQSYPRFYTREYADFVPEVVPQLEIEYAIVPEPSVVQTLLLAASLLISARAWRRRRYYS